MKLHSGPDVPGASLRFTNTVPGGQLPEQGESKKKGRRREQRAAGSCVLQLRDCSPVGTGTEVSSEPRTGTMPSALPVER